MDKPIVGISNALDNFLGIPLSSENQKRPITIHIHAQRNMQAASSSKTACQQRDKRIFKFQTRKDSKFGDEKENKENRKKQPSVLMQRRPSILAKMRQPL